MRRLSILLAFLLAAPLPAAPLPAARGQIDRMAVATPDIALAADAEDRWIPFTLTPGNQLLFDLDLDGRSISAILDTGVSYSVLSRRYAAGQRLAVRAVGRATAIGGAVPIGWVDTRSLSLGGLTRTGG
ncbi:aspartyl protease family protein, partial [Sphingomonas bacterium]|uniref:aspartyl protease family protein n=1 Tax=Sphingomonas bacterium TaxID=1895847 RepID=UPI0020C5E3F1